MTETESRHYRGWTSTYHAALRELGMEATPSPKPRWQPPAASLPAAPTEADLARSERLAQRAAQRSQVMTPTLTAALDDPRCFAGSFDAMSWDVWRVFLKALEALPMDEAEMALYRHHTGHTEPPTKPARYAELVVGRRGGKSHVLATIATYRDCVPDHSDYIVPGETPVIAIIAKDRDQAKVIKKITSFVSCARFPRSPT